MVAVAYLALLPDLPLPVAGSDAAGAAWRPVDERPAANWPSTTTGSSPTGWSGPGPNSNTRRWRPRSARPEFTIADLREVYERVWRHQIDPRNFHRKVTGADGFVEPVGRSVRDRGRPAQLFRRGGAAAAPAAAAPGGEMTTAALRSHGEDCGPPLSR